MKKQLLTSILALGLVLSTPISTINNPSYASELSDQDIKTKFDELTSLLNGGRKFDPNRNDNRLANEENRKAYEQAYNQALEFLKSEERDTDKLDIYFRELKESYNALSKSASDNIIALKEAIIKAEKLLFANKDKIDDKDQAYLDLNEDLEKAEQIFFRDNFKKAVAKDLISLNEAINKNFLVLKEKFQDEEDYEVSVKDIRLLEDRIYRKENEYNTWNPILDDKDKLLNSHKEFIGSNPYKEAKEELKDAYTKAYDELSKITITEEDKLNNTNYEKLLDAIKNTYQARVNIDGKHLGLKTVKLYIPEKDKLEQVKKDLDAYITDKENIEKILKEDKFKDENILKDAYKENIEKAIKLKENKEASLEDYTKLNNKLKEITDEIKLKIQTTGFKTVEEARDALKRLVNDDQKDVKKSSEYINAEKEAKDIYDKAIRDGKDILNKLANGEKLSLDKVNDAYNKILEAKFNLKKKAIDSLKELVDADEEFRKTDKFKKLEADSSKKETIDHYNKYIKLAKEELAKTSPELDNISLFLKVLRDSKKEINGEISSIERKLKYEIYISDLFTKLDDYTKPKDKDAAQKYAKFLEIAKDLVSSGKADSPLADDISGILTNARKYLGGEISKERYTINKDYVLLKMVKAHEDYKNVNQVSRERLEKALELAEDSMKNPDDKDKQAKALQSLGEVLEDPSIKAIIKKIYDSYPLKERESLLEDLNKLVSNDAEFKKSSFKYQKAKKVNRDAYDQALASAKEVIAKDTPSLDEVNRALTNLKKAIENLDGDKFPDSILALANEFKEKQKLIPQDKRQAMADRINSLNEPGKTMDDYEAVKKEFYDLINDKKVSVTTTTVAPTTSPVQTVTKAGSPVKTGINGIAKVAIILVVAAIIYVILKKKGENNEINK